MSWGVAVSEADKAWDGRVWFRSLASNNYGLVRLMQVDRLPMEQLKMDRTSIPRNDEDQLFITKFDGATIQFTGHFNPDTTGAAAGERKLLGRMPGPLQSKWDVDLTFAPERTGTMAGSLQVFGKRGLAKALNLSPIRLIGPAFVGGSGKAEFIRTASKTGR